MNRVFGASVRRGALWSYVGHIFMTLLHFAVGVLMARLLGPAEFGVFIAVTAFISLALVVIQFGVPAAIIQAKTVSDAEINAGFWSMLTLAVVFALIGLGVAGPLGRLYASAQFVSVFLLMCTMFFLAPAAGIGLGLLRRAMQFDVVAKITMVAGLCSSGLSVSMALAGFGVYSLAFGGILGMVLNILFCYRRLEWRPSWPQYQAFKPLFHYAGFTALNSGQEIAIGRADNMIIGAAMGTGALGLYNRAYSLARLPAGQFSESLGPMLLGAFSRIQTDLAWSRAMFHKAVCAISVITVPFLAFFFVCGPGLVVLLYGEAWAGVGLPLQVMAVGAILVMLTGLMQRLAFAQGLVGRSAGVNLIILISTVALVLLAVPFGLIAVAAAIVLREAVWAFLVARLLNRSPLALRYGGTLRALAPAAVAGIVGAVAGRLVMVWPLPAGWDGPLASVVVSGGVLFLCYGFTLLLLMVAWRHHDPLAHTRGLILDLLRTLRARLAGFAT